MRARYVRKDKDIKKNTKKTMSVKDVKNVKRAKEKEDGVSKRDQIRYIVSECIKRSNECDIDSKIIFPIKGGQIDFTPVSILINEYPNTELTIKDLSILLGQSVSRSKDKSLEIYSRYLNLTRVNDRYFIVNEIYKHPKIAITWKETEIMYADRLSYIFFNDLLPLMNENGLSSIMLLGNHLYKYFGCVNDDYGARLFDFGDDSKIDYKHPVIQQIAHRINYADYVALNKGFDSKVCAVTSILDAYKYYIKETNHFYAQRIKRFFDSLEAKGVITFSIEDCVIENVPYGKNENGVVQYVDVARELSDHEKYECLKIAQIVCEDMGYKDFASFASSVEQTKNNELLVFNYEFEMLFTAIFNLRLFKAYKINLTDLAKSGCFYHVDDYLNSLKMARNAANRRFQIDIKQRAKKYYEGWYYSMRGYLEEKYNGVEECVISDPQLDQRFCNAVFDYFVLEFGKYGYKTSIPIQHPYPASLCDMKNIVKAQKKVCHRRRTDNIIVTRALVSEIKGSINDDELTPSVSKMPRWDSWGFDKTLKVNRAKRMLEWMRPMWNPEIIDVLNMM